MELVYKTFSPLVIGAIGATSASAATKHDDLVTFSPLVIGAIGAT